MSQFFSKDPRILIAVIALLALASIPMAAAADGEEGEGPTVEQRLDKVEAKSARDRVHFTGDFRFEAHSISAEIPDHFNGLALQKGIVDTLFYFGATGQFPAGPTDVPDYIAANYGDYLYFQDNVLTFDYLKTALGQFTPQAQQGLLQQLLPATFARGYDANNSIVYTNRLRLRIQADVADNVTFDGRLSMYKVWGDSTGVQVFNGQPNTINFDGTTVGVPNSDILRVERAYFDWKEIGGLPLYLSIGRRPSTDGAPLHLRQDEPRGGTPLGSVVNYQFDGITAGYHINEFSTVRLCYGLGYESGFGNGLDATRSLDDAQFIGVNWDIYNSDATFIQATAARAVDVTDGFNGLVVLPADPLSGNSINAPVVLRYSPSANIGNIDLASVVAIHTFGPVDAFVSLNWSKSDPDPVTTPFGGMLADPFDVPESETGSMFWVGARWTLPNQKTKIGLEFNHGSQYWFNFVNAEDDLIAPKTNTRGDVIEAYLTHRISPRFIFKASYIDYSYDYSGSGWLLGAPKPLDEQPILGFPTYESASKAAVSFVARF